MWPLLWIIAFMASFLQPQQPAAAANVLTNAYFVEMSRMDCVGNPTYFANLNCKILPPLNRTMEFSGDVVKSLPTLTGYLRVSLPNPKKVFTQIFDITFDVCKAIRDRNRKLLIDFLVRTLARNSNVVMRCPFPKGNYYSKNISVNDLPPMLTETEFMANFDLFIPKVAVVLNVTLQGHLFDTAKENARRKKYL
ncbi:uncharacterized protein LOC117891107 [Drosophila subobscura]|uniref:uncharacterized protein LOC117891107 n=1 Tax=Drosophila subobscura TaxID=7241 RepID=UPI00155B0CFD|nr:uncharacterized protein LOC117891107 [Drosophila subobscura]